MTFRFQKAWKFRPGVLVKQMDSQPYYFRRK